MQKAYKINFLYAFFIFSGELWTIAKEKQVNAEILTASAGIVQIEEIQVSPNALMAIADTVKKNIQTIQKNVNTLMTND